MGNAVLDEFVAAIDILTFEAESIVELFYEEAEAAVEFVMEAAAWMKRASGRAVAV